MIRGAAAALALAAPAKVNLDLRVVGRRDDGFHLLETTMVLLELADRLMLLPGASGLRVEGASIDVPLDERNLAWQGLVAGLGAEPQLTCLTLDKVIPSAAGLGGGSSDAAAGWRLGRAVRAVTEPPAPGELEQLAEIGADVPFFAAATPAARVGGIGERVTPLQPEMLHIVLVHPSARLSTAAVFAELRADEWGSATNDLEAAAQRLAPEIGEAMAAVVAAGGEPRMSGSGPTVFSATDDPERARHLAEGLRRRGARRVTLTRTRREAATIERVSEEE